MSTREQGFMFITGLVLTMAGVGGVENSMDNTSLVQSTLIALVGLAIMGCGVLANQTSKNG